MALKGISRLHYAIFAKVPTLVYNTESIQNQTILSRCSKLMTEKYYPTWYLFNGHLQTAMLSLLNEYHIPEVPATEYYHREVFTCADTGQVSLDWAFPTSLQQAFAKSYRSHRSMSKEWGSTPISSGSNSSTKVFSCGSNADPTSRRNETHRTSSSGNRTVLLLHGLSGGSSELYIRSCVEHLVSHGWTCVVMNARGCEDTPVTTPRVATAAWTKDLGEVIAHLRGHPDAAFRRVSPHVPLVAIGFSLGSNVLVKYCGEAGRRGETDSVGLSAAISIGNPFDLSETSAHLTHRSRFRRLVYNGIMTQGLIESNKKVRSNSY